MSKGWESKNVEEQQAEAAAARVAGQGGSVSADEVSRKRRIAELELQRERVLGEQTANPHRRSALQAALATIERDLELLGWSVKL